MNTVLHTEWQAVWAWRRLLLCGQNFIKLVVAQSPSQVVKSPLKIIEIGLAGTVLGVIFSRLEKNACPASSASSEGRPSSSAEQRVAHEESRPFCIDVPVNESSYHLPLREDRRQGVKELRFFVSLLKAHEIRGFT